ncbi:MAG: acetamidase/formamidase family protein [Acidobacteriaceae bacterium]
MRLSRLVLASTTLSLSASLPFNLPAQTTQTLLATPSTVAWGFYWAHAKPVLTIHSGDTVIMQTASTCGSPERLESEGVKPDQIPAWLGPLYSGVPQSDRGPGGHILTGPIAIAEAQPGDVLEVRVLHIDITTDFACNGFGAGRGFLPDDFPYGRTKIIPLNRHTMTADFAPGITIPLHPFFGSMGIAPPESAGKWNSAPPWMHGGNMDNKELTVGSTIFYPVNAPGALFEAGDGHAGQGNGEVDITALETFLTGTFQFIVHKGEATREQLLWPRAETPTEYISMGFSPDLKTATEMAVRNMITFLSRQNPDHPHLSRDDAYALISTACDVDITQLVDTNDGVHVICPKALFTGPTQTHNP